MRNIKKGKVFLETDDSLKSLYEHVPAGLYRTTPDGEILMANPALVQMLGMSSFEELSHRNLEQDGFQSEYSRAAFRERLEREGEIKGLEAAWIRKDGSTVYVRESAKAIFDASGKVKYYEGVVEEISERKREEEPLRNNTEQYRILMEQASDGIFVSDANGRFLDVNMRGCMMLGYSREEILRMILMDLIPPEDLALSPVRFDELQSGKTLIMERRLIRKNGSLLPVEISARLLSDGRYQGIVRDISERKHSDEELKKSEEKFRGLVTEISEGIFVTDNRGVITFANPALARIVGAAYPEQLIGRNFLEFVAPSMVREVVEYFKNSLTTGRFRNATIVEIVHADGTNAVVEVKALPVMDHGKVAGTRGVLRDITEQKRSEDIILAESNFITAMLDSLPGLFYLFDEKGTFLRWNKNFETVSGYSSDEISHLTPLDFFEEPDKTIIAEKIQQVFITGSANVEADFVSKNKTKTRYSFSGSIFTVDGKPALIGMGMDITERLKAVETLRNREAYLTAIIENQPGLVWLKDTESKFLAVNHAFAQACGKQSPEEVIGKLDSDVWNKELAGKYRADDLRVMQSGESISVEEIVENQGIAKWFDTFKTPVKDDNGNIIGTTGYAYDITERKQMEDDLRLSEEKFARLFNLSPDAMNLCSVPDGKYIAVNQSFVELSGYTLDDVIDKSSPELDFWVNLDQRLEFGAMLGREGGNAAIETTLRMKDGRIIEALMSGKIIDINGTSYLLVITRDITKRKQAEQQLNLLSLSIQSAANSIVITDRNGIIIAVNPAFCKITGYSTEEVLGKKTNVLKSGKQPASFYKNLWDTILSGEVWKGEIFNKRKDGTEYAEETTITPVRDAAGEITHFIAIKEDVTEWKNLQTQLNQAQKMESIGTLASGIAHDFNNILGIIMGHSSLLQPFKDDPQKLSQSIGAITEATQRGALLVKQILTFARKTKSNVIPVNVNTTIGEISKMLGETFPKTIDWSITLDEKIPNVIIDPTQLHQALLNLCLNARDAMNGKGTLQIQSMVSSGEHIASRMTGGADGMFVCISVTDSGSGMSDAVKQRIFDPFFTTKEIGKGTGLGLAVVYGVVQSHGGYIDVESEVGHGTKFQIFLPASKKSSAAGREQQPEEAIRGGSETILIVEDEQPLMNMLTIILESKGYHLMTARDGVEALNLFEKHQQNIHLVLTDLGLPKLSGADLIPKLKQYKRDVHVIIASGFFDPDVRLKLLIAGVKDFVQKPYSIMDIQKKVREVLDRSKSSVSP